MREFIKIFQIPACRRYLASCGQRRCSRGGGTGGSSPALASLVGTKTLTVQVTSHSGQLMLSSRCFTIQLCRATGLKRDWIEDKRELTLQNVCRHSVTVVASTKYPEQIWGRVAMFQKIALNNYLWISWNWPFLTLQVIISLIWQMLILFSPAVSLSSFSSSDMLLPKTVPLK